MTIKIITDFGANEGLGPCPGAGAGRPGLFFGGKEGGLKGGQVKVCIVNVVVTTNGEGEGDGDVVNSVNGCLLYTSEAETVQELLSVDSIVG